MHFYAYIPDTDGKEPLGSANRIIIRDLKTVKGCINRIKKFPAWNKTAFVIQSYTNFYDNSTFRTIYTHKP